MLSIFVGTVLFFSVVISGSMNQVVGSFGEDNTRDVLGWAKRRRLIWGWAGQHRNPGR